GRSRRVGAPPQARRSRRRARVPLARRPRGEGALHRLVAHRRAWLRAHRVAAADAQPAHPPADAPRPAPVRRRGRRQPPPHERPPARGGAPPMTTIAAPRRARSTATRAPARARRAAPARTKAPARATTRPLAIGRLGGVLAVVTVFALVTAVVFHVVLAQH